MHLGPDFRDLLELFARDQVDYLMVAGYATSNKRTVGRAQDLADGERIERTPEPEFDA